MSYVATVVASLIGRIEATPSYITKSGSAHGANMYFPVEFHSANDPTTHKPKVLTVANWHDWYQDIIATQPSPAIVKDGWVKFGERNWESVLEQIDCTVLLSAPQTDLDWYYCWFNMIDKIPRHVYKTLMHKSVYHPRLWHKFKKHHRVMALAEAMPIYPLRDDLHLTVPNLRYGTTEILADDFPVRVADFLIANGHDAALTKEIVSYHCEFIARQAGNYSLAKKLASGQRWAPRGPWDAILFSWMDRELS